MRILKFILFLLLLGFIVIYNVLNNWQVRDRLLEWQYDLKDERHPLDAEDDIKRYFKDNQQVNYADLPKPYLEYTRSNISPYAGMLGQKVYHQIDRTELNRRFFHGYRLKDFLCTDKYYKDCVLNKREDVLSLISVDLILKFKALLDEMDEAGLDSEKIHVTNGHRHPRYNEAIGGASKSRHIHGDALDFDVGDVDGDGQASAQDKKWVLDILEHKVIRDAGGIGRYPGTQSVHMDLRGYKARWDSY